MVTTIKITCDGVFIQSNSLRAAAAAAVAAAHQQQQQEQQQLQKSSAIATAAGANGERIIARIRSNSVDRCRPNSAAESANQHTHHHNRSLSGKSSPSQSSTASAASSENVKPHQQQRRYYFGAGEANNIYWCKQALLATTTTSSTKYTKNKSTHGPIQRSVSVNESGVNGTAENEITNKFPSNDAKTSKKKKKHQIKGNSISLSAAASGGGINNGFSATKQYSGGYRPAMIPTTANLIKLKGGGIVTPPSSTTTSHGGLWGGLFSRHTPRRKLRRVSSFDCVDSTIRSPTGSDLQRLRMGVARFSTATSAPSSSSPQPQTASGMTSSTSAIQQKGEKNRDGKTGNNDDGWIAEEEEEDVTISRESERNNNKSNNNAQREDVVVESNKNNSNKVEVSTATTKTTTAQDHNKSEAFNTAINDIEQFSNNNNNPPPISSAAAASTSSSLSATAAAAATVMHSHGTAAAQSGQTSIVGGHHRGFSQSSAVTSSTAATAAAAAVSSINSSADPWFLQSTGHQMPPTAPIRQNKRPAPQPTIGGGSNTSGAAVASALLGGGATVNTAAGLLQHQHQQQQLQQHHQQHHHTNLPAASSGHHLTANGTAGGLVVAATAPKSPNQQQQPTAITTSQQQQSHSHHPQQHILSTFGQPSTTAATSSLSSSSSSAVAATPSSGTANAVAAVTQQQQQQHLQLLSSSSSSSTTTNSNNLMSSSLNAVHQHTTQHHPPMSLHERGLPPKSVGNSSVLLQHTSAQSQPSSLQMAACLLSAIPPATSIGSGLSSSSSLVASSGMSTSLHNFDHNGVGSSSGGGNGNSTTPWTTSGGVSSLSPTTALHHQAQQQHRKLEVKLHAMPWFHGSITRDEAEHLLQPRSDGLFLVRESTNFPGDYTLCVCFQGKVEHYRVKYLENKLTIDDEEYFENLSQLVAHYEADADGLCTQLINCLPRQGQQEFCINSQDFADKGWVIAESDLLLRESIGKGEFGDVLLGLLRGEKVAVKMLKDEGAVQKFLAEASVMTTLEHENLVKFIGLVFSSKNHIYLVTEYMSKGSLVDYLRSRGRQHITKKDQINFACDTASGMEYLEAKKVVHRDLAARNVLISETCVAKVSDFGLAREECYNLDVGKLPIKWTAPEALKNGRFSNKSDMWSFGILLWEIYSFGRVPYPRIPLADVMKHVEVGYKMELPEGCPSEIYDMMLQAWDLNPAKRPNFSELKVKLQHLKNVTA